MLKYSLKWGGCVFSCEKAGARKARLLLLFSLVNILILSVVVSYAEMTAVFVERGESVCAFYNSLHFYCPGCGGSRSLLSLLRFDFLSSFLFFPALIPSVIIFLAFDLSLLLSIIKDSSHPLLFFPYKSLILIPVIIILNLVIRNSLLLFFGIDYIKSICL